MPTFLIYAQAFEKYHIVHFIDVLGMDVEDVLTSCNHYAAYSYAIHARFTEVAILMIPHKGLPTLLVILTSYMQTENT